MSEVIQVRSQYRMREWAKIIQECEASGLSNKEFCEQNGVSIKSYYYWLRKLREAAMHQNQPSLVQLMAAIICSMSAPSASFLLRSHHDRYPDDTSSLIFVFLDLIALW